MADHPTAGTDLVYHRPGFAGSDSAIVKDGLVVPSASTVKDPNYIAMLTSLGLTPGKPFPNNTIPHQLFDPNAVLYLNSGIIPNPTTGDDKAIANVANSHRCP